MEQCILATFSMTKDTVQAFKFGQMEPSMRVSGKKIRPVVRVSSSTLTVTNMKENGKQTNHMGMEFSWVALMDLGMKDTGKMIIKMVKA